MRHSISNTAEYGDLTRGPRIVGPETRARMRELLAEIRSGAFAEEWTSPAGQRRLEELRAQQQELPVEEVGRRLRSMMGWLPDVGGRRAEAARRTAVQAPAGAEAGAPGRSPETIEVSA
jgi:ketol-acid reductoisomerase